MTEETKNNLYAFAQKVYEDMKKEDMGSICSISFLHGALMAAYKDGYADGRRLSAFDW